MRVTKVTVRYARKWRTGEFETADLDFSVEAEIAEVDDLHQCMTQLWAMAKNNVRAQSLPLLEEARQQQLMKDREIYLGLPGELQEKVREVSNGSDKGAH